MKINNITMLNAYSVFNNKFNTTSDMEIKWKIMNIADEIFQIKQRFDNAQNIIVGEYGKEDENGQKSLSVDDEHFQELLRYETDISPIYFDDIKDIGLSFEDMMMLKPILEK